MSNNHPINEAHQADLLAMGIDIDIAVEEGVMSVHCMEDLPEEFHYLAKMDPSDPGRWRNLPEETAFRTGLRYQWHSPYAGPEPVNQLKFDHAPYRYDDDGEVVMKTAWVEGEQKQVPEVQKYLFPKGRAPGLWVSERMRARLGTARYLVIVEGTKQYLTVCSALDGFPEYLVVGVAGCYNWSKNGMPSADLDYVATGVEQAFVIFDGDCLGDKANENVYNAAKAMDQVLTGSTSSGERPRFVHVPTTGSSDPITGSKENGIDDWLGQMPNVERRSQWLINTMKNKQSTKTLPAKFPGKRKASAKLAPTTGTITAPATLNMEAACVVTPPQQVGGVLVPGQTVAHFAPRIVRKFVVGDLHNYAEKNVFYDIEIVQDGKTFTNASVPDAALDDRKAFAQMLRAAGLATPRWVNEPRSHSLIVAAMRYDGADNAVEGEGMVHTGWWDHPEHGPVFLVPDGAVTRNGFALDARTFFEKGSKRSSISLGSLADASDEEVREAVRETNAMFTDCVGEGKTAMFLGFGHIMLAAAAAKPVGSIYLVGGYGSGKSRLQEALLSFNGTGIEPEMMIDQSTKNAVKVGLGLSHLTIGCDDIKAHNNPDQWQKVLDGAMLNIRRGYDGGNAGSAANVKSETSRTGWAPGSPDKTDPNIIFTGELYPPELAGSDSQRLITWQHEKHHLTDVPRLRRIAQSGAPSLANAAFIRQVATWMAEAGGMRQWLWARADTDGFDGVEVMREKLTAAWASRFGGDPRNGEVAAGRVIGWRLWTMFCAEVGVWTAEEAEEWARRGEDAILAAAQVHYHLHSVGAGNDGHALIRDIEGVLMSPHFYLKERGVDVPASEDRRTPLGAWHEAADGQRYVCLHPLMLEQALRRKTSEIRTALQMVAEPRVKKNGTKSFTRPVSWHDGRRTATKDLYWIPEAVWTGADRAADGDGDDEGNTTLKAVA